MKSQTHLTEPQGNIKKQTAIDAVLKAIQLCEQVQAEMVSTDAIQKADRSPVTVADFGSQALICQAIGDAFPDAVYRRGRERTSTQRERGTLGTRHTLRERLLVKGHHFQQKPFANGSIGGAVRSYPVSGRLTRLTVRKASFAVISTRLRWRISLRVSFNSVS